MYVPSRVSFVCTVGRSLFERIEIAGRRASPAQNWLYFSRVKSPESPRNCGTCKRGRLADLARLPRMPSCGHMPIRRNGPQPAQDAAGRHRPPCRITGRHGHLNLGAIRGDQCGSITVTGAVSPRPPCRLAGRDLLLQLLHAPPRMQATGRRLDRLARLDAAQALADRKTQRGEVGQGAGRELRGRWLRGQRLRERKRSGQAARLVREPALLPGHLHSILPGRRAVERLEQLGKRGGDAPHLQWGSAGAAGEGL